MILYHLLTITDGDAGEAPPDESMGQDHLSVGQIMKRIYDVTDGSLRISALGAGSGDRGTDLDAEQILRKVYDPETNSLRTVT